MCVGCRLFIKKVYCVLCTVCVLCVYMLIGYRFSRRNTPSILCTVYCVSICWLGTGSSEGILQVYCVLCTVYCIPRCLWGTGSPEGRIQVYCVLFTGIASTSNNQRTSSFLSYAQISYFTFLVRGSTTSISQSTIGLFIK